MNDTLTFYEELKSLRDNTEILNKISTRIRHAEEALRRNANGFTTEINISPGEWLSWKEFINAGATKPVFRVVYTAGDYQKLLIDTKSEIRFKAYKHLIILIREINDQINSIISTIEFDNDPVEGLEDFETALEEKILKGDQ